MTDPIIDPSTLTEQQRGRIKDEIIAEMETFLKGRNEDLGFYGAGIHDTLHQLFGNNFFESPAMPLCPAKKGGNDD